MLKIYLYDGSYGIMERAKDCIVQAGCVFTYDPHKADVAVAPLLKKLLTDDELKAPRFGTLVFHPSLLPVYAGLDSVRWAFRNSEKFSGATWFWADSTIDGGDICEQEVLEIIPGETPREFYDRAVIPSAMKLLGFALQDIKSGHIRRRPQRREARTYYGAFKERVAV